MACHILVVVLVDLELSVLPANQYLKSYLECITYGVVASSSRVGESSLPKKAGHEVVKLSGAEPISSKSNSINTLQLGDPPGRTRWDLLCIGGIFINI